MLQNVQFIQVKQTNNNKPDMSLHAKPGMKKAKLTMLQNVQSMQVKQRKNKEPEMCISTKTGWKKQHLQFCKTCSLCK
jgi:hypothetical protein